MTFADFQRHVDAQRAAGVERFVLPLPRRLSADLLTPVSAFLALRESGTYPFLLESVEGGERLARYSFLGKDPYRIVRAHGEQVEIQSSARGGHIEEQGARKIQNPKSSARPVPTGTQIQNVFDALRALTSQYEEVRVPGLPRFTGGAVGYLGYDAVRLLEDLPDAPPDDLGLPDACWCFYDTLAAFDHVRRQLVLMASTFFDPDTDPRTAYDDASTRLDRLEADLRSPTPQPAPVILPARSPDSNATRADYEAAVRAAKHYIYEGDIFQVVLSRRFALPFEGDGFTLYRALRQVNPSPYLFYLDFEEFALAGSSPEVLVRVENRRAEVLPIAGTRPRGATQAEDEALEAALRADPKERAEHLMLVDLGRNDLGRVCRYGSVEVDCYATVERYSHVMHLVSSVHGRLGTRQDALGALAACFPAGTVSGAPKVRAMEIIDELEPTRRGVYAGAVGYLDFSGTLDTCIAIRTMLLKDETAYVQAGAGIVADSDPAREYDETASKAQALREAIRVAAEGLL